MKTWQQFVKDSGGTDAKTYIGINASAYRAIQLDAWQQGMKDASEIATKDWGSDVMRNDILTAMNNRKEI